MSSGPAQKKARAVKKHTAAIKKAEGPAKRAEATAKMQLETNARAGIVYTSFPIAQDPDHKAHADRMAVLVRLNGGVPLNPLSIEPYAHDGICPASYTEANGHSAACFLRQDIIEMLECDYILFGQGCWESIGCRLEMTVAELCGIPFWFEGAGSTIVDSQGFSPVGGGRRNKTTGLLLFERNLRNA